MLDAFVRPFIDKPLNFIGKKVATMGVRADDVTFAGFAFGLLAMALIALEQFGFAAFFLAFNRLSDGLDGAVARATKLTDFGGFLDIVCDFIIYAGVVFAFIFVGENNAPYATFLIFCFMGTATSFLAYAIIAAKKNKETSARGKKSFYYLGGLCEGTETVLVLMAMCFFPGAFKVLCIVYGVMCVITTFGRTYAAFRDFS